MRQAALVLGLIGSLLGFGGSYYMLAVIRALKSFAETTGVELNNILNVTGTTQPEAVEGFAWFTLGCFAVAIVAAALISATPKLAGWTMILAGAGILLLGVVTEITGISAVFVGLAGVLAVRSVKITRERQSKEDERATEESEKGLEDDISSKSLFKYWWEAGKRKDR
ncbi:MAG: hypothetical protein QW835_07525 [Candidatus Hadarchaeum sp.]